MLYTNKEVKDLINRDETIICDWDNVIQNIDVPWLVSAYENKDMFKNYFDYEDRLNVKQKDYLFKVLGREEYYLDKWLKKEDVELTKEIREKFLDLYISDKDFYKKCKFTQFAEVLSVMAEQKFCREIMFLSHSPSPMGGIDKRKEEIFMHYKKEYRLDKNSKVNLTIIDSSINKHDWVKKNMPEYTTAVDDRFDIINGYIQNTDPSKKIYLLPRLGYNSPIDKFVTSPEERLKHFGFGINIQYINPF